MLADQKKLIDLTDVVQNAGVELNRNGMALCPFHNEKTPSLKVYTYRVHCFGCGFDQDVIGFVMAYYNLSFQDAIKHLGIEGGELTPEKKAQIERRKIERQKAKAKKKFKTDLQNTLLILISATKKAANNLQTIDDFDKYGKILQPLSWWEYCLDLLSFGTKSEQNQVYQHFKDEPLIPVKEFFRPEFDYIKWLNRAFKNGEPKDAKCKRIGISFNGT